MPKQLTKQFPIIVEQQSNIGEKKKTLNKTQKLPQTSSTRIDNELPRKYDLLFKTKQFLCQKLEMKNLREASYAFGLEIHRDGKIKNLKIALRGLY